MNVRHKAWLNGSALVLIASLAAGAAFAQESGGTAQPGAGGEGVEANNVVVTAERSPAAAAAPAKASLEETQPESIISRKYIEQATPETGGWASVVSIAPSVSVGATSNGGGIGDYQTPTLRGFQDGEYNITYDGIAFGDTNNPTHHSADYFPTSTIGSVVIDRGPGAAGDLGQANFGGAIHFFSPPVSDTFGVVQKVTYGSYDSVGLVTTLNTGTLPELGGGKLLVNLEERTAAGELTHTGGYLWNQMVKYVLPIGDKLNLTVFGTHEYTRFNFPDSNGPGETWQQTQLYGKNFSLTNTPDEFYYKYNYERKQTDFEYVDLKYQALPTLSFEDQLYTYWYANKTISSNDNSGIIGGPNTSPTKDVGTIPNDIEGYNKLNGYRVLGDVVRLNKEWSFGTLKLGGLVETSSTERHKCLLDLTTGGTPDVQFLSGAAKTPTNCSLQEHSDWEQGQAFADFNWTPTSKLTISPGFKYVVFKRDVDAAEEKVVGGLKVQPLFASNTYASPLYFLTANYKIRSDWSVYAQYATSFLIPELSELYSTGANIQKLQSEYTTNYQAGTVYTHGNITADADVYEIDATNLQVACTIPSGIPGLGPDGATCNEGKARFSGVEGEGAYHFPFGLTLFANGSLNTAKQLANAANAAAGIAANPAEELPNSPKWTDAFGAILDHGPWEMSLTYKQSGAYVVYNVIGTTSHTFNLSGFDSFDGSVSYDFGRVKVKLQGFNLLDRRSITDFVPESNATTLFQKGASSAAANDGFYTFQTGRDIQLTLIGKF
jgi:iron complex outermembrane receptor protein